MIKRIRPNGALGYLFISILSASLVTQLTISPVVSQICNLHFSIFLCGLCFTDLFWLFFEFVYSVNSLIWLGFLFGDLEVKNI